jgi:hypothetical protein
MEADRERLEDTRDWRVKAARDLRAADVLLASAEPLSDAAAFHAQQAAEKSLKAFRHWHDVPFRKTHEQGAGRREPARQVRPAYRTTIRPLMLSGWTVQTYRYVPRLLSRLA